LQYVCCSVFVAVCVSQCVCCSVCVAVFMLQCVCFNGDAWRRWVSSFDRVEFEIRKYARVLQCVLQCVLQFVLQCVCCSVC